MFKGGQYYIQTIQKKTDASISFYSILIAVILLGGCYLHFINILISCVFKVTSGPIE